MDSLIITRGGKELVSRLIEGSTTVKFTKIRTSDHDYSAISDLTGISELESIKQEVPISKITRVDDTTVVVRALMDNKDLSEGYYVRTAGLYAKDGEENEILFGISVADEADHMPAYGNSRPSGIIFTMNVLVDNAKQVVLNIDPTGAATIQDIMDIESPEFDDSGTVEGISSFPSFLETMKSKMNFFQFFRNLKAGLQFVLHTGQIVNNCVTDNAGLPLSAAQGKALMDKYTQLYSEMSTLNNLVKKSYMFKWEEVSITIGSLKANGGEVFGKIYNIPESYFENNKWTTAAITGFYLNGNGYTNCSVTACRVIGKNVLYSVKNMGSTDLSDIELRIFTMFTLANG